jgi:ethanolamine ammonia-lyase small subunit
VAEIKGPSPDAEPTTDVWTRLRTFTPARVGLGRTGASLPTQALLDFELAHARARDAVHATFDAEALARNLRESGFDNPMIVASQAQSRMDYLLRPDLGRTLDAASRQQLQAQSQQISGPNLVVVIADGLSAIAPARHALPLLNQLRSDAAALPGDHWKNVTVVVANYARVALGEEIGQILRAQAVVVLIGERPGLSSPDSLGIYLTWAPRIGRTDAERNCISNVRPDGLPYREAATRLAWLLSEARRLQLSGVALKDDSEGAAFLP